MGCEYADYYELECALGREDPQSWLPNGFKGSSTKVGATAKVVARNRRRSKLAKKQRKFNRR